MKRILVVDDTNLILELVKGYLEDEGYRVDICGEADKVSALTLRTQYDLILLDIIMPVMNGVDVLKRIKDQDNNKETPVIMLSARDDMNSIRECLLNGAVDYVTKPFNMGVVKERIEEFI